MFNDNLSAYERVSKVGMDSSYLCVFLWMVDVRYFWSGDSHFIANPLV